MASAHGYLGFASWLQGDFEQATVHCTAALAKFRELGDVEGIAWSLLSLGAIARYQSEPERAAALLAESRSLAEGIGFREGIAWALEQLGLLAADRGDPAAAGLLRQSLEIHRELQDRWRTSSVLEDLAALALATDAAGPAARLLAAAQAMRDAIGTVIAPCESAQHTRTLASVRAALGDDAFAAAWQQGLLASIDDLEAELPISGPGPAAAAGPAAPAPGTAAPEQPTPPGRAASRRRAPAPEADPAQAPAAWSGRRYPGRRCPGRRPAADQGARRGGRPPR